MESVNLVACEFIRFCVGRRGREWPVLYDEMCRVAGQRRFKGLGYAELKEMGISLGLTDLDKTFDLVEAVTSNNYVPATSSG